MKTSELTGPALGWAVAVADKRRIRFGLGGSLEVRGRTEDEEELPEGWDMWMLWYPQANWSQGGPIIERKEIETRKANRKEWGAWKDGVGCIHDPTPLIAAMRCYVASKLGDEVDIPKELQ